MSKTVWITSGDHWFNQMISHYLLQNGHVVYLQFNDQQIADDYAKRIAENRKQQFYPMVGQCDDASAIRAQLELAIEAGGLDLFIHGNEWLDEEKLYDQEQDTFGQVTTRTFQTIFLWSQQVSQVMIRKRKGHILFPLISDTLYYLNYPVSPVLNHGKIAMMKTLAKELAPFNISVNALTLGYYDHNNDSETRKELKKNLEIYALKPQLPKLEQMIPALAFFLQTTEYSVSGQNVHIGSGIETSI